MVFKKPVFKVLDFKKPDFKKPYFKKLGSKKLGSKKLGFKKLGLKLDYHGHLAHYAQSLMMDEGGGGGKRRLIDLHGFAAGKNEMTSEAIWRPLQPQRPPKWQLESTCTWMPG